MPTLNNLTTHPARQRPSRLAIVAALDALEVGDHALAVEILLDALEGDGQYVSRCRCECGAGFEWPGLLDAHRLAVHYLDDEEADRAA